MKKHIHAIAFGSLLLLTFSGFTYDDLKQTSQQQVLQHVVLLDLNDQATDSVTTIMNQDLEKLKADG